MNKPWALILWQMIFSDKYGGCEVWALGTWFTKKVVIEILVKLQLNQSIRGFRAIIKSHMGSLSMQYYYLLFPQRIFISKKGCTKFRWGSFDCKSEVILSFLRVIIDRRATNPWHLFFSKNVFNKSSEIAIWFKIV